MKIWSQEHVFNQPWEVVTRASWNKYPNPFNTSVVGVDVLKRVHTEDGILRTHRLLTTQWGLPAWSAKLIGMDRECHASELSEVDTNSKTMTLTSKNLSFCRFVSIDEKLVYQPHPSNPEQTILKQESIVEVNGVPLTSYMEHLIVNTISDKADQGRYAMDWVCNRINEEMRAITSAVNAEVTELAASAKKGMQNLQREIGDITEQISGLDGSEPMNSF